MDDIDTIFRRLHAPLTVAAFTTALSVLYCVAAVQAVRWRFPAGRILAGAGTVLVGVAVGWVARVSATVLR